MGTHGRIHLHPKAVSSADIFEQKPLHHKIFATTFSPKINYFDENVDVIFLRFLQKTSFLILFEILFDFF